MKEKRIIIDRKKIFSFYSLCVFPLTLTIILITLSIFQYIGEITRLSPYIFVIKVSWLNSYETIILLIIVLSVSIYFSLTVVLVIFLNLIKKYKIKIEVIFE